MFQQNVRNGYLLLERMLLSDCGSERVQILDDVGLLRTPIYIIKGRYFTSQNIAKKWVAKDASQLFHV